MSSAIYSFINSITNSITSKYDIKSHISNSRLWKVYHGVHKTTKKKVAIFIFEKKSLELSYKRDRGASRSDIELLKKEASSITRLRHPSILEVVEPMAETRSSIAFVTEPLMNTLSELIANTKSYSSEDSNLEYDLDELEIQKGLLQVGKGLQFLSDAKVVHHNLTPDAIFVNAKGDWKIGGLGFSIALDGTDGSPIESYLENNGGLPDPCQINLDYAAPEFVLHNHVTQANDLFALGCLAYTVHSKGETLLQTFNSMRTYERKIQSLGSANFSKMPPELQGVIRGLLARQPEQRMSLKEFQNSRYFDNLLVSTMKFLESFPEKTRDEKTQFMKGLARVLDRFPPRVLKHKILPSLLEELKDHLLLPFTVPNIFIIAQKLTEKEFCELALPSLKPIFNVREPPQNMVVLLERLDILQKKTPPDVFREDVMPLVYAAMETDLVEERALKAIPSLAKSLDYKTVKNSLFPRLQTSFAKTTNLSVKVSTLQCFHSMIEVLDKFTMHEKLIPLLKNIKTKEPAVMLAALAVYAEMGKHLDREVVAAEILPQLWRMSVGPLLNVSQFEKFMKAIQDISEKVKEEHLRHLRQVKSLEDQTRSVTSNRTPPLHGSNTSSPFGTDQAASFEDLVQGSSSGRSSRANDNDNDMFSTWGRSLEPASPTTSPAAMNTFTSLSTLSSNKTSTLAPMALYSTANSRPTSATIPTIPTIPALPNPSMAQRPSVPFSSSALLQPVPSSPKKPLQPGHKVDSLSQFDPLS